MGLKSRTGGCELLRSLTLGVVGPDDARENTQSV